MNRPTVSFEDIAYSNMLTVNALIQLLDEKGILKSTEIVERVKKLQGDLNDLLKPEKPFIVPPVS
jgi:hypothetical protein